MTLLNRFQYIGVWQIEKKQQGREQYASYIACEHVYLHVEWYTNFRRSTSFN